MISFMNQLGRALAHSIKHYLAYLCEVWVQKINIEIQGLGVKQLFSRIWVGFIQSTEGLQRAKGWSPMSQREFCMQVAISCSLVL